MKPIRRIQKLPKRVQNRRKMLDKFRKGGLVVEVGVLRAKYSQVMWNRLSPDRMVLIDIWQDYNIPGGADNPGEEAYHDAVEFAKDKNVELWKGKSSKMIPKLPDHSVRVAYVDAAHNYEAVLSDLELMLPKMEPRGWLCGHDYCAIVQFGVVRAVAAFCDRHDLQIDILTAEKAIVLPYMPLNVETVNLWSFAIQIP